MKLLVDANLSPRVAEGLRSAGFDAVHVADLSLLTSKDDEIFDRAIDDGRVVITADGDFGTMPALRRAANVDGGLGVSGGPLGTPPPRRQVSRLRIRIAWAGRPAAA